MTRTRLTASERQEQIICAALTAFAQGGYAGTSTDQVARLSGVSQPYVIRIFGTKRELFLATVHYASQRVEAKWRAAAAREPTLASLGSAYHDLLAERELLVVLLHGFAASEDPAVGDAVRAGYGNLYQTVRDLTGATAEEARDFFAMGMLITVLGAMRVLGPDPVATQPWMTSLISTFPAPDPEPGPGEQAETPGSGPAAEPGERIGTPASGPAAEPGERIEARASGPDSGAGERAETPGPAARPGEQAETSGPAPGPGKRAEAPASRRAGRERRPRSRGID